MTIWEKKQILIMSSREEVVKQGRSLAEEGSSPVALLKAAN